VISFQSFKLTHKYWELYASRIITWGYVIEVCKWLGGFWMIIEPLSYFSYEFDEFIKTKGVFILLVAIFLALIQKKPRLIFKYYVTGKDVYINIIIGDILKIKNKDLIIPTNTHFITEIGDGRISENSIQGQFTRKYFSSISHLDNDIEKSLSQVPFSVENPEHLGKKKVYNHGTTAMVSVKKENRRLFFAYFFAFGKLNKDGVCQSNIGEFQQTLPSLWDYIYTKGEKSHLAVPILGSGFTRIDASREELFKEILLSFLAATRNASFCRSLTFVIYYKDICEMDIDIESIKDFTRFQTSNFIKENKNDRVRGTELN